MKKAYLNESVSKPEENNFQIEIYDVDEEGESNFDKSEFATVESEIIAKRVSEQFNELQTDDAMLIYDLISECKNNTKCLKEGDKVVALKTDFGKIGVALSEDEVYTVSYVNPLYNGEKISISSNGTVVKGYGSRNRGRAEVAFEAKYFKKIQ